MTGDAFISLPNIPFSFITLHGTCKVIHQQLIGSIRALPTKHGVRMRRKDWAASRHKANRPTAPPTRVIALGRQMREPG
jgi:hypothetical protein